MTAAALKTMLVGKMDVFWDKTSVRYLARRVKPLDPTAFGSGAPAGLLRTARACLVARS